MQYMMRGDNLKIHLRVRVQLTFIIRTCAAVLSGGISTRRDYVTDMPNVLKFPKLKSGTYQQDLHHIR